MPELVKLYKNLRDLELNHMLYKTKEGLQKEAFDCADEFLRDHQIDSLFAIKDSEDYFVIKGSLWTNSSIGE